MNVSSSILRFSYGVLRSIAPTVKVGNVVVLSRYDQVKEVLNNGYLYRAPYLENLKTLCGDAPDFILGMDPGSSYNEQRKLFMDQVRSQDITNFIPDLASTEVKKLIGNGGEIEVVAMVRRAASRTLLAYFGIGENLADETLSEYEDLALSIFKYQFMDDGTDTEKKEKAKLQGQRLFDLIEQQILMAKQSSFSNDNLLGRYLSAAEGSPVLSDKLISTALFGFIVGGLPQPSMVVPNALNELIHRPHALKMAMDAAETNDAQLEAIFFEALRFDPLAPMLKRTVVENTVLSAGTSRERKLVTGDKLIVMFASAMQDHRRVENPRSFNPNRPKSSYMHFGFGHHECFATAINRKMLPAMIKPLLIRNSLTRADGKKGRLKKVEVAFPESLYLNVA